MKSQKIISEISRMKSLFNYQKGVVISEQFKTFQKPPQQKTSGFPIDCTGIKVGLPTTAEMQQNFASNSRLDPNRPENKIFFCDTASMNKKLSEIRERANNIANMYSKVNSQGKIIFPGNYHNNMLWSTYVSWYNVTQDEMNAAKQKASTLPKDTPVTLQFVAEKFPLKFMMQGENIKKLQKALGLVNSKGQPNITGKFYNSTQKALDAKVKELGLTYDRNVGLDETSFNKIIQGTQSKRQIERPVSSPTKTAASLNVTTNVPTNISAQPTQTQTPQTQLTLDQQFQVAKSNFDTAKAELDAAQKTGDRAAIEAARGKQQAARKEVQRLRGNLATQNQTPQ